MGIQGITCCIITLPLSFYHPVIGMCLMGVISNHYRDKVIAKYNVEENNVCWEEYECGCCTNACLNFMHYGCNYPCSFFQMYVSMVEWDLERSRENSAPPPVVVAQGTVVQRVTVVQGTVSRNPAQNPMFR